MSNKLVKDVIMHDGIEIPNPEIMTVIDNEFLEDFHGNNIYYTKDFYVAMYKKIQEGKTYVEAYNELGFDTKVLGTNRANAAGKRAMQLAKQDKLFTVNPANYDGSVPREKMGDLTPEEELAYLKARNAYLEETIKLQKKMKSVLAEMYTPSKTQKSE